MRSWPYLAVGELGQGHYSHKSEIGIQEKRKWGGGGRQRHGGRQGCEEEMGMLGRDAVRQDVGSKTESRLPVSQQTVMGR